MDLPPQFIEDYELRTKFNATLDAVSKALEPDIEQAIAAAVGAMVVQGVIAHPRVDRWLTHARRFGFEQRARVLLPLLSLSQTPTLREQLAEGLLSHYAAGILGDVVSDPKLLAAAISRGLTPGVRKQLAGVRERAQKVLELQYRLRLGVLSGDARQYAWGVSALEGAGGGNSSPARNDTEELLLLLARGLKQAEELPAAGGERAPPTIEALLLAYAEGRLNAGALTPSPLLRGFAWVNAANWNLRLDRSSWREGAEWRQKAAPLLVTTAYATCVFLEKPSHLFHGRNARCDEAKALADKSERLPKTLRGSDVDCEAWPWQGERHFYSVPDTCGLDDKQASLGPVRLRPARGVEPVHL